MKFILYGISGGFYFSPRYPKWIKFTWIFLNSAVLLVILVFGIFLYLISLSTRAARDVVYAALLTNSVVMVIVVRPLLTYYFKNEIEEALTLNEKTFFANVQGESAGIQESKGKAIRLLICQLLAIYGSIFLRPLQSIYADDLDFFNRLDYYLTPHILLGQVQTQTQYYMIVLVQSIPMAIFLLTATQFSTYVFFIGHEFCTALSKLQSFLKDISELFKQNIEQIYENAVYSELKLRSRRPIADAIDYHRDQLMMKVKMAIQAHECVLRYV